MHRGHYIILTHYYTPMKDDPTKHNVTEKCEFVTDIKNRHESNATVIIDVINKTFVKNRVRESSYNDFIAHIEKTHPNEYGEFKKFLVAQGLVEPAFADKPVKVEGNTVVA